MGTYVLHEHTFPCQEGRYPFEGEEAQGEAAFFRCEKKDVVEQLDLEHADLLA
jgi:hypothetical protein